MQHFFKFFGKIFFFTIEKIYLLRYNLIKWGGKKPETGSKTAPANNGGFYEEHYKAGVAVRANTS